MPIIDFFSNFLGAILFQNQIDTERFRITKILILFVSVLFASIKQNLVFQNIVFKNIKVNEGSFKKND